MLSSYFVLAATSLALILSSASVHAHPGEKEPILSAREVARREAAMQARYNKARNCDSAIAAYEAKRKAKRALLAKRQQGQQPGNQPQGPSAGGRPGGPQQFPGRPSSGIPGSFSGSASASSAASTAATSTSSAYSPHFTEFQNTTCVLTPESEEGPYYIHEELIRTNVREDMEGIPLTLDLGVMDITTCTPMENVMVDIWHCNATGIYSGFIASESSNTGNSTDTGSGGSMTAIPSDSAMPSGSAIPSGSAAPSGSGAPGGGVGGGGGGSVATDQETFGRGAYPTNSDGIVEFTSIFPGFYSGRTVHIHTVLLTNYTTNSNGTLGLEAGHIRHIGQVFFEESWTELVVATSPYNQETIQRTTNDEDRVYAVGNTAGYNATAQLSMLGDTLEDGLLGYITIGIDPTASYELESVSYHTGDN